MKVISTLRLLIHRLKWRHWVLIALLLLVTLFRTIPSWGYFYTLYIYPLIGRILSPVSGIIPFAVGDVFIASSIAWCVIYPVYAIAYRKRKKLRTMGRVAEYLLWVYAWFYMAWGLNYSQPVFYQRVGKMPAEVSEREFKEFAYRYADSLNCLSEERRGKSEESSESFENLKNRTREAVLQGYEHIDKGIGINRPFNSHPKVKTMVFSPLSSMAGVTGSMGPFFCEFTLNGDIREHDYPATYAHEFAHFLGVANEGEANFYSYMVCTRAKDKAVRFSGYYHIFFHVLNNVFDILGEKEGEKFMKYIRPEIIELAKSDREYWLGKRCKALDAAQDFLFELYLRGNHVEGGRKSYSHVISLILTWEEKELAY